LSRKPERIKEDRLLRVLTVSDFFGWIWRNVGAASGFIGRRASKEKIADALSLVARICAKVHSVGFDLLNAFATLDSRFSLLTVREAARCRASLFLTFDTGNEAMTRDEMISAIFADDIGRLDNEDIDAYEERLNGLTDAELSKLIE
jgi:hypothetical protein